MRTNSPVFPNYQYLPGITSISCQPGKFEYFLFAKVLDQQNKALEAAMVTLRYFTALCLPMGKTREIFNLHFLAKQAFFQASYCDVTKVEVPNCLLTCNMRNEFVAVRVYQAVKYPATTDEFAADFSFMPE